MEHKEKLGWVGSLIVTLIIVICIMGMGLTYFQQELEKERAKNEFEERSDPDPYGDLQHQINALDETIVEVQQAVRKLQQAKP